MHYKLRLKVQAREFAVAPRHRRQLRARRSSKHMLSTDTAVQTAPRNALLRGAPLDGVDRVGKTLREHQTIGQAVNCLEVTWGNWIGVFDATPIRRQRLLI